MSLALNELLRLPAGAIITCPNPTCGDTICRTKKDINSGTNFSLEIFDLSEGQGIRLDKSPRCKVCNHTWFVSFNEASRIHTARGWFPSDEAYNTLVKRLRRG